jgi:hypothetical protein
LCLGLPLPFSVTQLTWNLSIYQVELDGASYLGLPLPFSVTQLTWIEALLVGGAEVYRNTELDPEKRIYPGAWTDIPVRGCVDWTSTRRWRMRASPQAAVLVTLLGTSRWDARLQHVRRRPRSNVFRSYLCTAH